MFVDMSNLEDVSYVAKKNLTIGLCGVVIQYIMDGFVFGVNLGFWRYGLKNKWKML